MLRFLRTQGKRTKTIWWVLIIVTVVTFLGGFVFILGSGLDSSNRARASGAIGVVDGMPISRVEYQDAVTDARANFKRMYGTEPGERDLKMLEVQAWRSIALQKLMSREAKTLGIGATDHEVVVSLKTNPPPAVLASPQFQTDGKFDSKKYQTAMMDPNNVREVARLEEMTREQLPTRKLQERLLTSIKLAEPEMMEAYRQRFERVSATLLVVPPSTDVKVPPAADADLQRLYDKYKARFTMGARTQVEALIVNKQFGDEEVRVARELSQSLADRARRGEDFASLARDYSEGPGAESGGVIDRAFQISELGPEIGPKIAALDTGGVTDPIRDSGRFMVMRLVGREASPNGMPALRIAQIVVRIRPNPEKIREQYEGITKVRQQATKIGLGKAAAAKGLPTTLTSFFDAANTPTELYGAPQAADWALTAKKGLVSPVFEAIDEFVVVQVTAQIAAGPAPRDEVPAQLRQIAELEARVEAAKPRADAAAAAIRQGGSLEQAAKSLGLTTNRIDGFTRVQPDPRMAEAPEVIGALFATHPGQVVGPIRIIGARGSPSGWYLARVEEHVPADMALYEQVKSQLSTDLLQRRQQTFIGNYMNQLRLKAKIKDLRNETSF